MHIYKAEGCPPKTPVVCSLGKLGPALGPLSKAARLTSGGALSLPGAVNKGEEKVIDSWNLSPGAPSTGISLFTGKDTKALRDQGGIPAHPCGRGSSISLPHRNLPSTWIITWSSSHIKIPPKMVKFISRMYFM